MQRLEGKVAIITGATGGIGAVSVKRFLSEGAKVAVAGRSLERAKALADQMGPNAFAVRCELSEDDSIKDTVEQTVARFGRLDILFNNGAATDRSIQGPDTTIVDIPFETWDEAMSINVRSAMVACRFAIPHMLKSGGGSIINVSSDSGLAGDRVRVAYGTSKAALMAFTRYAATQYGRQGIRCNCIAPGFVVVPKAEGNQAMKDLLFPHVLTPRLGIPEDIAALAAYLAADESGYVTGQIISCDGGLLAHQPHYAQNVGGAPV